MKKLSLVARQVVPGPSIGRNRDRLKSLLAIESMPIVFVALFGGEQRKGDQLLV
ncbi:MAG TPA: hypothetical protein VLA67_03945 [Nitrospiraceae bacterium]|nr:hypothetical protein [Nitrospiraceae bacterium]